MQQMIEGKGVAPHFQMEFGSLVEQLLLCMTRNAGDYLKNVVREVIEEYNHTMDQQTHTRDFVWNLVCENKKSANFR